MPIKCIHIGVLCRTDVIEHSIKMTLGILCNTLLNESTRKIMDILDIHANTIAKSGRAGEEPVLDTNYSIVLCLRSMLFDAYRVPTRHNCTCTS